MIQRLSQSLHEPNSGEFQDEANLAIIDAIGVLEERPWPWNTGEFSFTTAASDRDYDIDTNVDSEAKHILAPLICEIEQSATNEIELDSISMVEYERRRMSFDSEGWPEAYAVWGETIYLLPTPDGQHNVRGRYIKALTKPESTWSGSTWTHSAAGTTSAWFEVANGFALVHSLAAFLLASGTLGDQARAQSWMIRHQQEVEARMLRLEAREPLGPLPFYL